MEFIIQMRNYIYELMACLDDEGRIIVMLDYESNLDINDEKWVEKKILMNDIRNSIGKFNKSIGREVNIKI